MVNFPSQIDNTNYIKPEYNKTIVSDNKTPEKELVSISDFDIDTTDEKTISKQPIGSSSPVYDLGQTDEIRETKKTDTKIINPIIDLVGLLFYFASSIQNGDYSESMMNAIAQQLEKDVDFISKHGTAYEMNFIGNIDVTEDSLKMQNDHLKKQRELEQQEKTIEQKSIK